MGMVPPMLAALAFTTGGVVMKHAAGVRHAGPVAFGVGAMLFDEAATWRTLIAVTLIVLGIALLKID